MLRSLSVRQFALIEEAEITLSAGMTVFSGETGAGKSILVDALGAAFGARASSDWVRFGAEKAEVVAMIESRDPRLAALLAEQEIDVDDGLILRRVVGSDGRSKAWVNGVTAPTRLLQQIGDLCLDLHGQHEHQALLHPDFQRQMVDARIDPALLAAAADGWRQWQAAEARLSTLHKDRDGAAREEQWMRDELARLEALQPGIGIEAELEAEVEAGRHFELIQRAAAQALTLLDEGEPNVRDLLADSSRRIAAAAPYAANLHAAGELLDQIEAQLGEAAAQLRESLDAAFDAEALHAAEERLLRLREALRRHRCDEAGLLELMRRWREQLSALDTAGWDEERLLAAVAEARRDYEAVAARLSAARTRAGNELVAQLRPLLDRLALAGMAIEIELAPVAAGSHGVDTPQFMAASNPGEPFRPLAAIASGGELSRFVLALKGCGAMVRAPGIAVFDEVDVGIGGETAWRVGELLAAMGRERQVLVVSHLAQVAACADWQVAIRKEQAGGRTLTRLELLRGEERCGEIARMLGGGNESRDLAETMLRRGHREG